MSFDLPFLKATDWSVRQAVLVGLVALHVAWVIFHMVLVAGGKVDPWKFGGYGMYTTASPNPRVHVLDGSGQMRLNRKNYVRDGFKTQNYGFVFRCRPISEKSVRTFFTENPHLVGTELKLVVTETRLLRMPIRKASLRQSVLDIGWVGASAIKYRGRVCGKDYSGQIALKAVL